MYFHYLPPAMRQAVRLQGLAAFQFWVCCATAHHSFGSAEVFKGPLVQLDVVADAWLLPFTADREPRRIDAAFNP